MTTAGFIDALARIYPTAMKVPHKDLSTHPYMHLSALRCSTQCGSYQKGMAILLEFPNSAPEHEKSKRSGTDLHTTTIARAAISLGNSFSARHVHVHVVPFPARLATQLECSPPGNDYVLVICWYGDSSQDLRPSIGAHAKIYVLAK